MADRDDEFSGSWRMKDEVDGFDLFAGVRWWVTKEECGFSMNDGKGGPAESIIFTHTLIHFAFRQIAALYRRNAYRRRREYAKPNFRPALRDRLHEDQVFCTDCQHSGFVQGQQGIEPCSQCGGTGWMDPPWLRRIRDGD